MNIPQEEGVQCVENVLASRPNQEVPSGFIARLLELVLKHNIFEIDNELYQQQVGTAMGCKPAPSYANIHLAQKIDQQIIEIAKILSDCDEIPIKLLKRFLDDIFMIFTGSVRALHMLFEEINKIHPKIKFTMAHTTPENQSSYDHCPCEPISSIPFLDTLCIIKAGNIETDLYRKPTDKNTYLLTNSCHPTEVVSNIPYSLAMRINRVCSENITKSNRLKELEEMLLERNYPKSLVKTAINKAIKVPRDVALRLVSKKTLSTRPVFVVLWDPRLPSVTNLTSKHWRSMTGQDPYLWDVFPEPPMVAYKRQRNIRDKIIRAKIPAKFNRTHRTIPDMKKCGNCVVCLYVTEGIQVKSKI